MQAYQECDLLCFVSTVEGFGLPILEAQAVRRPVLTSNLSAMPEVAGEAACFTNPFDINAIRQSILLPISDVAYIDKLIEKGYENVQRFSWKKTVAGYARVYSDLLH